MTIQQKSIEAIYPLSPLQKGMLYHILNKPEQRMYFEHWHCTLTGDLDVNAYKQAWQTTVQRHASLRTVFSWKKRKDPLQIVLKHVEIPWSEEDWRHLSEVEQEQAFAHYLQMDEQQGFELTRPLLRFKLIRLANETYRFIWSHHHILFDGWSFGIILTEVVNSYHSLNKHGKLPVLPMAPQYGDYITWLQNKYEPEAKSFWQEILRGFTTPTPIVPHAPIDKRQTQYQTSKLQHLKLDEAVCHNLQKFAQKHHLTLNTLFQAAWAILLSRYNSVTDVVYGVTVSGRPASLRHVESMVGLFINTLPLRVTVAEEEALLPWLQQLQNNHIQLEQYAYSTLTDIQSWSEVPPDRHLFDNLVVFENFPIDENLNGHDTEQKLQASNIESTIRVNYPLVMVVIPRAEVTISVGYDPEYIHDIQVCHLFEHLQTLLTNITKDPHQRLRDIPLLSEREERQILREWNDTTTNYPADHFVHQLFEEVVCRTPDAVAVKAGEQALTYAELNARANQFGHFLQAYGVGPGVFVAIWLERSLEMVVSILGILKAGGTYVPIDPTYPQERFEFILQDTNAKLLITRQSEINNVPVPQSDVIAIDAIATSLAQYPRGNLNGDLHTTNSKRAAYVMYTSGSTGKPKGSLIPHHGISRLVLNTNYVQFSADDTVAHGSNTSFDAATFEIWGALLTGARLLVLPTEMLLSPEVLCTCLQKENVDVLFVTPALYNRIVMEKPDTFHAVRDLVLGGEALAVRRIRECLESAPPQHIWNGYGPTENTTFTTAYRIDCVPPDAMSIPIGKPIANTQVYILDEMLRPLPAGVLGELYLGGDGLALGYLNQPGWTAARFIPHPFSHEAGRRLYRTGDIVRYRHDGHIEFYGRADRQVKIRGFRIEPGEVEEAIAQFHNVKDVVVTTQQDPSENKALVAYVVPKEEPFYVHDLKERLAGKLPAYMLPSAYVILSGLPITPNGKVDQDALPEPTLWGEHLTDSFVPPRSVAELQLTRIWETVLERKPIGVKDNFFMLGGHSLLAVHLMSRIHQEFGKNLPLSALFENPTIEHLAHMVTQVEAEPAWSPVVAIQKEGSHPPFFCVSGAGGNVLYFYHLAHYLGHERPFYGLQALGLDAEAGYCTDVEEMAASYIDAVQSIQPHGPYYLGGHSFGSWVAFEMARQLWQSKQEVALLVVLDTPSPSFSHTWRHIQFDETERLVRISQMMERWAGRELNVSYTALAALTPSRQLSYVAEKLKSSGILPPGTSLAQVLNLVNVFKANDQAMDAYVPRPTTLPCRVALFQATEVHEEDSAFQTLENVNGRWGWDQFTQRGVSVCEVPGDHITMLVEPHVQVLAKHLRGCFENGTS